MVTPDARKVATASADGEPKVWDLAAGQVLYSLARQGEPIEKCAVTPDGKSVVSASKNGVMRVWDMQKVCLPLAQTIKVYSYYAGRTMIPTDAFYCDIIPIVRQLPLFLAGASRNDHN